MKHFFFADSLMRCSAYLVHTVLYYRYIRQILDIRNTLYIFVHQHPLFSPVICPSFQLSESFCLFCPLFPWKGINRVQT